MSDQVNQALAVPLPVYVPTALPRLVTFKNLTPSTWTNWKDRTRDALVSFGVWDHVESDLSATRPTQRADNGITPAYLPDGTVLNGLFTHRSVTTLMTPSSLFFASV